MKRKEKLNSADVLGIAQQYDKEGDTWATDLVLEKVSSEKNTAVERFSDFFSTEEHLMLALGYLSYLEPKSRMGYVRTCEAIGDTEEIARRLRLVAENREKMVGTLGPKKTAGAKEKTQGKIIRLLKGEVFFTEKNEQGDWEIKQREQH